MPFCGLNVFEPHHLFDGLSIVFGKVNVNKHPSALVILMAVAHLALYLLESLLKFGWRKGGVCVGQQVEETVGLETYRISPDFLSEDNGGQEAAQSPLGLGDVLRLSHVGTYGEENLHRVQK